MRLLPKSRRGRVAVAVGLAALLLALGWCDWYRPWEARYLGRPTSWWAREYEGLVWEYQFLGPPENPPILYGVPPPREPAWWEQWLRWAGVRLPARPVDRRLLHGDPRAVPVLVELLRRPEN